MESKYCKRCRTEVVYDPKRKELREVETGIRHVSSRCDAIRIAGR